MEFGVCQNCVCELRVRTELDAPPTRQKYTTKQMLDQHGRKPLCTRCLLGTGSHSSDCRARLEAIWTKELAEAEVPIRAEAEVAKRAVDAAPSDPNVRVSEPVEPAAAAGGQPVAMEVNTDPVVEWAGGAAPRPDVSPAQPMEVSLEQRVTKEARKRAAETQLTRNSVEGYIGCLRSFDGHQDVQTNVMSAIETTNLDSAAETIDEDSRRDDYYTRELLDRTKYITGRKKELDQLESFGLIRRVNKSEATDGAHVRVMIIAHNKGDLVRWRLVSMEVNHYERHDVFAGTPALKVFRMLIATAASHSHPEHGHRKVIAILDVTVAFFHADMEDKIYAHPPAEAEPDRAVVWLLIKAHCGTRKAARLWQEFLRSEVFIKASWDAVAVEPNVYHKDGSLGDDDDACVCVHGDVFMVESRIDVFQDVKAMLEHRGQDRETSPVLEPCRFHVESKSQACA